MWKLSIMKCIYTHGREGLHAENYIVKLRINLIYGTSKERIYPTECI